MNKGSARRGREEDPSLLTRDTDGARRQRAVRTLARPAQRMVGGSDGLILHLIDQHGYQFGSNDDVDEAPYALRALHNRLHRGE